MQAENRWRTLPRRRPRASRERPPSGTARVDGPSARAPSGRSAATRRPSSRPRGRRGAVAGGSEPADEEAAEVQRRHEVDEPQQRADEDGERVGLAPVDAAAPAGRAPTSRASGPPRRAPAGSSTRGASGTTASRGAPRPSTSRSRRRRLRRRAGTRARETAQSISPAAARRCSGAGGRGSSPVEGHRRIVRAGPPPDGAPPGRVPAADTEGMSRPPPARRRRRHGRRRSASAWPRCSARAASPRRRPRRAACRPRARRRGRATRARPTSLPPRADAVRWSRRPWSPWPRHPSPHRAEPRRATARSRRATEGAGARAAPTPTTGSTSRRSTPAAAGCRRAPSGRCRR